MDQAKTYWCTPDNRFLIRKVPASTPKSTENK